MTYGKYMSSDTLNNTYDVSSYSNKLFVNNLHMTLECHIARNSYLLCVKYDKPSTLEHLLRFVVI